MSAQVFRKQYMLLGLAAILVIVAFISFMAASPEALKEDKSSEVYVERAVSVHATQSMPPEAMTVASDAHPADCSHCNTANTGEEAIPRLLATDPDLDYIFKGIAKQEDVTAPRSAFNLKGSQKGQHVSLSIANLELSGIVTTVLEDPNASAYAIKLENNLGRLVVNVDGNDSFSGQVLFFGDSRALIIRDHPDQSDTPKLIVEETKISDLYCAPKGTIYTESGLQSIKNAGNKDLLAKTYVPFAGIAEAIPLDSLPGAEFVMYLDFDGEEVTDPNWTIDGASIIALPHPKANDDSFVTSVWQRVAEDFAPFNITVTTDVAIYDAADSDKRLHVVITPTDDAAPGVGGVAYLFSFRNASPVVWVFNLSEYTCATTISHEAGHAFGLYHDGAPEDEYYSGHNDSYAPGWAPIMGAAFSDGLYDEVDQWSKGEYGDANNQEDDLLIIGGNRNGFRFKNDDYSDSIIGDLGADVGALSPIGVDLIGASGLISRSNDIDVFRFASTDGDISLTVSPLDVDSSDSQAGSNSQGANLAVQANLLDSNGLLIATGTEDGPVLLDSTLTATVSAGIYYISVEGAGRGADPATGFSDYASLGEYSIELALPLPPLSVTGGEGEYKHENPIVQGDVNTLASNGTDFGFSYEANVPVIHTFHLVNTETSPITNLSVELVSGDHFYITKSPNASIGGNLTDYNLSIAYDPDSRGLHTDTVIISYEAGDSVEYRFAISGTSTISGTEDNYGVGANTDTAANLKQVQNTWLSDYMGLAFFNTRYPKDFYSIDAHSDGNFDIDKLITVEVAYDSSEGPEEIVYLFELRNSRGTVLGFTTAEDGVIQFRLPGDYDAVQSELYIVASHSGNNEVNTAYDLRWSSIALTEGNDDLYEENDSLETAFDLTGAFSSRFSEYLGEGISNDEDWYKIDIPRDPFTRMLYVRADFVHAEGNIDIEVLDENGSSITSETVNDYEVITFHQTVSMDGFDENFTVSNALVMGVEPGTYYVRVHGDFAGNSYDLVVEARTEDRYEVVDQDEQRNDIENDRLEDAFDLGSTIIDNWLSEVDGIGTCAAYPVDATQENFNFASDADWFEFSANLDTDISEITIEYLSIDGGFMIFEVFNSDGFPVLISTESNGSVTTAFSSGVLSIPEPSDSTYFIKVTPFVASSSIDRSGALSGYDFRVTLTPGLSMIDGATEDNYEENDNFQDLFDLRDYAGFWLASVDGLGTQLDPDWYEISVPAGAGQLSLLLTSDSSVGNVDLTLSKKDGPKVFESLGGGNAETIIWDDPIPGAYAVTVSGDNLGNSYNLFWDVVLEDDSYEENDEPLSATDLSNSDRTWLRKVGGPGVQRDEDWYKINVPDNADLLDIRTNFDPGQGDIDLELYNASGYLIARSVSTDSIESLTYSSPASGDYYIQIHYGNAGNEYDLWWAAFTQVELDSVVEDVYENNNTASAAYILDNDHAWLSDLLGPATQTDDDWFEITLAEGNIGLDVDLTFTHADGDIDVEVYDALGSVITRSESLTDNESINYNSPLPAGNYQIRVYGANAANEYDLYWVDRNRDVFESNNTRQTAYDLRNDKQFYISQIGVPTQGNDDWYQIETIVDNSTIVVDLTYSHVNGDINLELYDSSGTLLTNSTTTEDFEYIQSEVTAKGIYYVRVWGDDNYGDYDLFWNAQLEDSFEENDALLPQEDIPNIESAGSSAVAFDDDWFAIKPPLGALSVQVDLAFTHGVGNLDLEAYDYIDGDPILIDSSASADDNETLTIPVEPNGLPFYVRVFHPDRDYGNTYSLTWINSTTDAYEGNNSIENAFDLTAAEGDFLSDGAGFATSKSEDWYRVDVTGLNFAVYCSFTHADGNIDIELFDANGNFVDRSISDSDDEFILQEGIASGTYYLKVFGELKGNLYDLIWNTYGTDADDVFEENDSSLNATDLTATGADTEYEIVSDLVLLDEDWFQVEVENLGDRLIVECDFGGVGGNLELMDPSTVFSGRDLVRIDRSDLPVGSYLVRITGPSVATAYTLRWSSGADDSYEENDSLAIPYDYSMNPGTFLSANQYDEDWYRVELGTAGNSLGAFFSFTATEGDLSLKTFDSLGVELTQSTAEGNGAYYWDGLSAGTYYIQVDGPNMGTEYSLVWIEIPDDNYEENDALVDAYDLSSDEGVDLSSISGDGVQIDEDWYLVSLPSNPTDSNGDPADPAEILNVELTYTHTNGDINFEVRDSSGVNVLASSNSLTDTESVSLYVADGNDYYIVVAGDNARNSYDLGWSLARGDYYEENDTQADAYDLSSDEGVDLSSISGPGIQFDEDWYKIVVTPGSVGVEVTFTGNPNLAVFDSSSASVAVTTVTGSVDTIRFPANPLGATYYFQVTGDNAGDSYDLIWSSSTVDAYEPNDDLASAADISAEQGMLLSESSGFGTQFDEDWYLVSLPSNPTDSNGNPVGPAEILDVELTYTHANGDINFEVRDSSGVNVLASSNLSTGTELASVDVDDGNDYYIVVTGDNTGDPYDLVWSLVRDDNYEENDTLLNADDLSSSSVSGVQFDEDWYEIITPLGSVVVEVTLTGNPNLAVFDSSPASVAVTPVTGSVDTIRFPTDPLGATYYFQVTGDDTGDSYDLIWSSSTVDAYEPNDTQADAYDLSSDEGVDLSSISGFGTQFDEDWYKIVTTPGSVGVEVTLTGNTDLEVFDSTSTSLAVAGVTVGTGTIRFPTDPLGATYYFQVTGDDTGDSYDLIWSSSTVDAYEPNDTQADAYDLSSDEGADLSSISGFGTQFDEDWYLVSLPSNPTDSNGNPVDPAEILNVELTYTHALPPTWELYDKFNGSAIDPQKWDFSYWDGGNLPTPSNGRALLSGNTVSNWGETQVTEAMLQANVGAANLVSGGEAHSILEFKDSDSILGIEMELTLPIGVSDNVGIGLYAIDYDVMFNSPNQDPVIFDLDLWNSSESSSPEVQITWKDPVSGTEQEANGVPVAAGQTVLLKFERTEDTIRFFVDDIQVAESGYSSGNETFMIRAVSEDGDSFLAYVDNVRVLRDTASGIAGDINLEVRDSSGVNVLASSNLSTGTELASVDVDDGNDYYIVVTGDDAGDPYDLVWSVVREDSYEENDTLLVAYDLSSSSVSGVQFDEDWYEIVTPLGSVGVEVTLIGNTDLEVFDSTSTSLAVAGVTVGTGTIRFPTDPLGATYYFQVTGDDTGDSYDLIWSSSTVDAYELNNFVEDAKILFSYEGLYLDQIDGHATQFDDDWYAVVVSEGSSFLIIPCLFTHADGDIDLELYQLVSSPIDERDSFSVDERKPKLLRRSTSSNNAELITLPNPEPGIYFIRAYFGNTGNAYRLFWDDGVDDAAGDADYIDDYLNENWVYAPSDNRALLDSPSANEDGDGFTNWEEYALGLDPSVQDYVVVGQSITEIGGKNYFQFEFLRRKEAVLLGYEFIVEESSNMAFNGSTAVLVRAEDVNSEIERVFYRGSLPMDEQSQCFFRLVVNEPISKLPK